MHVDRENKSPKFWLDPDVLLSENSGYGRKEFTRHTRITKENLERLRIKTYEKSPCSGRYNGADWKRGTTLCHCQTNWGSRRCLLWPLP